MGGTEEAVMTIGDGDDLDDDLDESDDGANERARRKPTPPFPPPPPPPPLPPPRPLKATTSLASAKPPLASAAAEVPRALPIIFFRRCQEERGNAFLKGKK